MDVFVNLCRWIWILKRSTFLRVFYGILKMCRISESKPFLIIFWWISSRKEATMFLKWTSHVKITWSRDIKRHKSSNKNTNSVQNTSEKIRPYSPQFFSHGYPHLGQIVHYTHWSETEQQQRHDYFWGQFRVGYPQLKQQVDIGWCSVE